jgi:hypothetical protein
MYLKKEKMQKKGYVFHMSFFSKLNLSKTQPKKTFKNSNAIQFKFCALNLLRNGLGTFFLKLKLRDYLERTMYNCTYILNRNLLWQNAFLICSWRFLISNKLEQLEFKLEKTILGFRNMQEKLEKAKVAQVSNIREMDNFTAFSLSIVFSG